MTTKDYLAVDRQRRWKLLNSTTADWARPFAGATQRKPCSQATQSAKPRPAFVRIA
jgi:hypothetical protein